MGVEEQSKPVPKWKKPEIGEKDESEVETQNSSTTNTEEESKMKKEQVDQTPKTEEDSPPNCAKETKEGEAKKEEEEEEDTTGMRAMRKETDNKFKDMEQEFEAGRSKLSALRAK